MCVSSFNVKEQNVVHVKCCFSHCLSFNSAKLHWLCQIVLIVPNCVIVPNCITWQINKMFRSVHVQSLPVSLQSYSLVVGLLTVWNLLCSVCKKFHFLRYFVTWSGQNRDKNHDHYGCLSAKCSLKFECTWLIWYRAQKVSNSK